MKVGVHQQMLTEENLENTRSEPIKTTDRPESTTGVANIVEERLLTESPESTTGVPNIVEERPLTESPESTSTITNNVENKATPDPINAVGISAEIPKNDQLNLLSETVSEVAEAAATILENEVTVNETVAHEFVQIDTPKDNGGNSIPVLSFISLICISTILLVS